MFENKCAAVQIAILNYHESIAVTMWGFLVFFVFVFVLYLSSLGYFVGHVFTLLMKAKAQAEYCSLRFQNRKGVK